MSKERKGLDKYGNPLPCRPLNPEDEKIQKWLFLPPPEVPTTGGRAELLDAVRPERRRRTEKPRPFAYRFWANVREGDRVLADGEPGVIAATGVHVRKEGPVTYVVNFALVSLGRGDTIEIQDLTRLKRVAEDT